MGCCDNRYSEYRKQVRWLKEYHNLLNNLSDSDLANYIERTYNIFKGQLVRHSHPLLQSYHMLVGVALDRNIAFYKSETCPKCGAPKLGFLAPGSGKDGIYCFHCAESIVPVSDLPETVKEDTVAWGMNYIKWSNVALWNPEQQKQAEEASGQPYGIIFERAQLRCKDFLREMAIRIAPEYLQFFPAIVWHDSDSGLYISPQDLLLEDDQNFSLFG